MNYLRMMYGFFFALFLMSCGGGDDNVVPDEGDKEPQKTVLKEASFGIGAAVKTSQLTGAYSAAVVSNFSQITGEYEMKMDVIWSGDNTYNWSSPDALVNYATTNNLKVHGHTLVWYRTFPTWFKNANYDSAGFESRVKKYIEAVVGRYKGKVISWDVANEIFNDNGTLRSTDCPVYKTFKDPIAFYGRCFQYVKNIDADVELFYNDYSVVVATAKRFYIKKMVERFEDEGYPIDGLGDQFHYAVNTDKSSIKTGLNDMASTGLLVHISELDLKVNVNKSDTYVFSSTEQQNQANMYQYVVETFESLPQSQKFAITTWGVSDKFSWLKGWWHEKEYPLLFDDDLKKKPAYDGFLKGLK